MMTEKVKNLTHIYLVDEQRTYLPEIKDRFENPLKYNVITYTEIATLLEHLDDLSALRNDLHIFFLSVDFEKDEETVKHLLDTITPIRRINRNAEVFILSFKKDEELMKRVINAGAKGLIQKNENAVLRITNVIKGIISEKNLEKQRRSSIFSIRVLLLYILAVAAGTVILYLFFPELFHFK